MCLARAFGEGRLYACILFDLQGDGAALASALMMPTRPERVRF